MSARLPAFGTTESAYPTVPLTVDQQPLNVPLQTLLRQPPVHCSPQTPLREALARMAACKVGSIIVIDTQEQPLGIFTLYDLLRVSVQETPPEQTLGTLMNTQLVTLPAQAPAWEAALAMARYAVQHVLVLEGPRLIGIISERDLFTLQRIGLSQLSTTLREADSLEPLVQAAADIRLLAGTLVAQGVGAEQITTLVSMLNDQLTMRIFTLESRDAAYADIDLCWLALGSEGRHEQTLFTDQDNALLFRDPADGNPDAVRTRLLPLAQRVNQALDRCGFPLCKGGVMASNPQWCLSFNEWQSLFARWIQRGDAPVLLNASIFFDFRPLHGNAALAHALRHWLNSHVKSNWLFIRKLVYNALGHHAGLGGLLRDFALDGSGEQAHTLDLKLNAITLFVDAARVFALAAGSGETNTPRRLRAAAATWRQPLEQTETWIQAFEFLQTQRLRHQHARLRAGQAPNNRLNPRHLNALDRRMLKESLREAKRLQDEMEKNFQF